MRRDQPLARIARVAAQTDTTLSLTSSRPNTLHPERLYRIALPSYLDRRVLIRIDPATWTLCYAGSGKLHSHNHQLTPAK